MEKINLDKYLTLSYTSIYIPICHVRENKIVKTYSSMQNPDLIFLDSIRAINGFFEYPCTFDDERIGNFGIIKYEDSYIIIGPFNETARLFDEIPGLTNEDKLYLREIPLYPYQKFLNTLLLFEYVLNNNEASFSKLYNTKKNEMTSVKEMEALGFDKDEKDRHNTYYLEQMILTYIKDGNPDGLEAFLKEYIKYQPTKYWETPNLNLRDSKNTSIGFVHEIIKFGAIEGGMDIEKSYNLMDIYVNKIEKCKTIEEVLQLRYDIILDLSKRVKEEVKNIKYSIDVDYAIQFIKNNTNKNIGVMDVVNNVNKSRSYLLKKFKDETGYSIGEYIMKMKLRDSCMSLKYSNYTIAEISYQFSFSSQSYYQNKFKKEYGMTPKEYRTKKN